jgi:hypothetical protein
MSVFKSTFVWALLGASSLLGCSSKTETPYDTQRGADFDQHRSWEEAGVAPVPSPATWPSLAPDATTPVNSGVGGPSTGAGGATSDGGDGSVATGGAGGTDGSVGTGGSGTGGSEAGSPDVVIAPEGGNPVSDTYVNLYLSIEATGAWGTPTYSDSFTSLAYTGATVTITPGSGTYTSIPIAYTSNVYSLYGYQVQVGTNVAKNASDFWGTGSGTGSFGVLMSATVCVYIPTCYNTTLKVYPVTYSGGYYYKGTSVTNVPVQIDCGGCG